jgi:hypothetical protein
LTKGPFLVASLLLFLSSCTPSAVPAPTATPMSTQIAQIDAPTLQILFIGNSHMYTNNLPSMFTKLANAGGHPVEADMAAKTGYLLEEHVEDPDTLNKINESKWDIVILQENSNIPQVPSKRDEQMYPAARALNRRIRSIGAQTILFMTWADPWAVADGRFDDFVDEQARITAAYRNIAQELDALVAPVGVAFEQSLRQRRDLFLWKDTDYLHASHRGTYLAACVLYALIYRQSPERLPYRSGLTEDTTRHLQSIAAQTVLTDSAR